MAQMECIRCKVCTTTIKRTESGIGSADRSCTMAIQSAMTLVMLTTSTSPCFLSVIQTTTLVEYTVTIATSVKIGGGNLIAALLHIISLQAAASLGMWMNLIIQWTSKQARVRWLLVLSATTIIRKSKYNL